MVMNCRSRWLGLEQEGFGIVFVEAAAAGVAQIAGRSGGSHEAVRHEVTGLILENSRSSKALAEAIEGLINDPERLAVLSHQARAVAERTWDWRTLATTQCDNGVREYVSDGDTGRAALDVRGGDALLIEHHAGLVHQNGSDFRPADIEADCVCVLSHRCS